MAIDYSNIITDPAIPLRTVLYLFMRTPHKKYLVPYEYVDRLITWLEPISIPTPTMQLAQVHNISSSNLQRFIARRLSCPYETIHWCIKYEVWPMLEKSGVIYEY